MKKIETFTTDETRFLSNFYPYKKDGSLFPHRLIIMFESMMFSCTENAYQAAKTLDISIREKISLMTPYEAKAFWEDEENRQYIRKDWEKIRLDIMRDLLEQKFFGHPELSEMLKATGNAILEEGNTWDDTFWGICNGIGENHLGKLLMEIRRQL